MDYLISRQAAIDAIYDAFCYAYCDNCEKEMNEDLCGDCHRKYQNWSASKKIIEKIINNLPSAQPEQRWIPCSERLPEEDGGFYLVTDYSKSLNRRRMHVSRCYANNGGFWSDVPLGYKVIAWMPLPEAYKGEGNG